MIHTRYKNTSISSGAQQALKRYVCICVRSLQWYLQACCSDRCLAGFFEKNWEKKNGNFNFEISLRQNKRTYSSGNRSNARSFLPRFPAFGTINNMSSYSKTTNKMDCNTNNNLLARHSSCSSRVPVLVFTYAHT